jgi:hypothetical protein
MRQLSHGLVLLAALLVVPVPAVSQADPGQSTNGRIAVFLDCHTRLCDFSHFRREITFVNWARDRQDADVHLLITQQRTAGGGSRFSLGLIGLRALAPRRDTVFFVTNADDTFEEDRGGLTRTLKVALVPYVWHTGVLQRLSLDYADPTAGAAAEQAGPIDDPWNYWVFRIGLRGSAEGESQERSLRGNTSVSASRITEDLKIEFDAYASGDRSEFDVVDEAEGIDTTFVSTRESYGVEGLVVWSLGPHWSAGALAEVDHRSTVNWDLAVRGGPAIEYNVFPYDESTWHRFTIRYVAGIAAFDYTETTIFNRTSEIRPVHVLEIEVGVQQPWGSIHGGVDAFQYLHDLSKHSVSLGGGLSLRVFRGLDFNVGGDIARIKDQIYLSQVGLTPEEVLLQRRERGTDFRYELDLGFSYRFGSKFNNVVNTRM